MVLFDERLTDEILTLLQRHHQGLGDALGLAAAHAEQASPNAPLRPAIELLIAVANGRHMRTPALVRQVEQALAQLMAALLGNPLGTPASLPMSFWHSDIGILVSRARWWVSSEDLITISNAAALAFGANTQANRMRIARAIEHGLLEWVPDPSVANPQQNRRVLRAQVERLRDLRGLPEEQAE